VTADNSPGLLRGAVCDGQMLSETDMSDSPCSGFWTVERVRLHMIGSPPHTRSIGVEVPKGGESRMRVQRLFFAGGGSNEELMALLPCENALSLTGLIGHEGCLDLGFCADVGISRTAAH
jgi:hypothetical protein